MSKKLRNLYRKPDGRPSDCIGVAMAAAQKLAEASEHGRGVYLAACEVRALNYCKIGVDLAANNSDDWLTEPAGDAE